MARMLRLNGETAEAATQVDRALELLEGAGSPSDELGAWLERGHQKLAKNDADGAADCLSEAQERLDRLGGDVVEAARKDRDKLSEAIKAARNGDQLLRGSRRESLPAALLQALEA
jgi:hypothetical protein